MGLKRYWERGKCAKNFDLTDKREMKGGFRYKAWPRRKGDIGTLVVNLSCL